MIIHNNSTAPELFFLCNANNTVDVYSFGCIILEILTNKRIDLRLKEDDKSLIDFLAKGNRPIIPSSLPDSKTHGIDMNHRM